MTGAVLLGLFVEFCTTENLGLDQVALFSTRCFYRAAR
jgi:hypothetical protein